MHDLISAEEALKLQRGVKTAERQAIEHLAEVVDNAVRAACARKYGATTVAIPEYIWGLPQFDKASVTAEIRSLFTSRGFRMVDKGSGRLTVIWGSEHESEETGAHVVAAAAPGVAPSGGSMIDDRCFDPADLPPSPPAEALAESLDTRVLKMV